MSFLITGNLGYVGPIVVRYLKKKYPEKKIIGYDLGLFAHILRGTGHNPDIFLDKQYFADVRGFDENILKNIDHVIHLAAISNDPIGNKFEKITNEINFKASIELLRKSVKMNVKSFTFASSCSVYGGGSDNPRNENDPVNPLTAYAKSKINFEIESKKLALGKTKVTCLRFATACGFSPRIRLDLVLNDFVASAIKLKKIEVLSDGSPLRPLIHVHDMAKAIEWSFLRNTLENDQHLYVNVGSNDWNYKIKELAQKTVDIIGGGCKLFINKEAAPDKRSYKVDFTKYSNLATDYKVEFTLVKAIEDLKNGINNCDDINENFRASSYMRLNSLNNQIKNNYIDENLKFKI